MKTEIENLEDALVDFGSADAQKIPDPHAMALYRAASRVVAAFASSLSPDPLGLPDAEPSVPLSAVSLPLVGDAAAIGKPTLADEHRCEGCGCDLHPDNETPTCYNCKF